MKRSAILTTFAFLVLTGAALVFLALELTIWSAPPIVLSSSGADTVVDSTLLGEYHLGLERIQIVTQATSETVIDLRDPGARLPNVFHLRAGENEIELPGDKRAGFQLSPDRSYTLTLCGDNGWGRVQCRSKLLRL